MRKFEELRGYLLNDVIGTKTGILTIAFPKLVLSTGQWPPVKQRAFLMAVNEEGNISTKASMSVDNSGFVYGPNTHVAKDGDRILVAVNRGRLGQLSSYERDVFGFPLYCFQNG